MRWRGFAPWLATGVALGIGTALVYPTLLADLFGMNLAIGVVAALTAASGALVGLRMPETLHARGNNT